MKNLIIYLAIGVLALTDNYSAAQTKDVACTENGIELLRDTVARLTLFTGRNLEGKTYLHWDVADQHMDGVYLIYRSQDNVNYSIIGRKTGIGTPVSVDIAYYFTDDFFYEGTMYYKLLHVSKERTFLMSERICVIAPSQNTLTATKQY